MKRAFTLVELIVVITILAILWTISFISLSWYSKEARDAKRAMDTSMLLSKINIEETRWTQLSALVTETEDAYLQILWKTGSLVKTFWKANFETLKENPKNFKDPSNKELDYPLAYTIWRTWKNAYRFVQIATILEKENKTVIKWNYYTSDAPGDAKSLFLTWGIILENWGEDLPYIPNEWEDKKIWELELLYRVWKEHYWNWDKVVEFWFESDWKSNIDWWDWNIEDISTWKITHTYEDEDDYIVKISGDIKRYYNDSVEETYHWKLIEVKKWDNIKWSSMRKMFHYASNLEKIPEKSPNLINVISMYSMFGSTKKFSQDLNYWDVSKVIDMQYMFHLSTNFNWDISRWNTSNVKSMGRMFSWTRNFSWNLIWNVSNVENMSNMFHWAISFNWNISNWDISKVIDVRHMFHWASDFNWDIGKWNTSKVTSMEYMFYWAIDFNWDISKWDTSKVTSMESMFYWASKFNQNLSSWDVSAVTNIKNFTDQINSWEDKNKPQFK